MKTGVGQININNELLRVKDKTNPPNIILLEGTGAYGPLLLAPAEGLGGPSGPLTCGGNLF